MCELLEDIHRTQRAQVPLQDHEPLLVEFSNEAESGKVKMKYLATVRLRVLIEFSADLACFLGYDFNMCYSLRHPKLSKTTPNLSGSIHSIYVYCDLIEHVPVGDTKAPLRRIVNRPSSRAENVHRTSIRLCTYLFKQSVLTA